MIALRRWWGERRRRRNDSWRLSRGYAIRSGAWVPPPEPWSQSHLMPNADHVHIRRWGT